MRKYHFLIAFLVVVADRMAKRLVTEKIALHDNIVVIPNFFRLTHVQNRGAAFGLFDNSPHEWKITVLVFFSVIALMVVAALLWRSSRSLSLTGIGLSLILGGAAGNLWDRLVHKHVVDFLDFYVSGYHWPAFNLADSAIVVGAILLMAEIAFAKQPQEATKKQVGI
jgi:signal peptidase II